MHASSHFNFIFIHNQKTAGCSMRRYFARTIPDAVRVLRIHAIAEDGIRHFGRREWNRFYTFGFVRNPWARLVSWYNMIQRNPGIGRRHTLTRFVKADGLTFHAFVIKLARVFPPRHCPGVPYKYSVAWNQLDHFIDRSGRLAVDFVGRFEHLEDDFASIQTRLDLPRWRLPHANTTKKTDYRRYFTDHTAALVADRFKRDIDNFGYTFDG